MNRNIILIGFSLFLSVSCFPQNTSSSDSLAIIQAAMDYADGYYSGDASRMENAIHPDFNKVSPVILPQSGKTYLLYSSYSGLIEMTRAKLGVLEEASRNIKVEVLLINEDIACAKVTTAIFNDYLQLARISDKWKIINVLWTFGESSPGRRDFSGFDPKNESVAIEKTSRQLIEGIYSADQEKVKGVLHPEFNRATLIKIPATGRAFIQKDGIGVILESTAAKLGQQDPEKWNIRFRLLDCMDELAMAEVKLPTGWNYLQLAKIDNKWQIINILRKINSPQK